MMAPSAPTGELAWRDAHGPLRGEVPWVLREDLLGPDTFLVVPTDSGDVCAEEVSFRVVAPGVGQYTVTLVSDMRGHVAWRVGYGDGKKIKLFTCAPRPADDSRRDCLRGGVPLPLIGQLAGGISARLPDGVVTGLRELRFEQAYPCAGGPPTAPPGG